MTKNNIRGYQQEIIDIIMRKLQQDVKFLQKCQQEQEKAL